MRDWMTWKAIGLALPVVLGPLSYILMGLLKTAAAFVDRQPAFLQRGMVILIAAMIATVANIAGADLPCLNDAAGCSLADLDRTAVQAILGSLVAMAMHALKKAPPQ